MTGYENISDAQIFAEDVMLASIRDILFQHNVSILCCDFEFERLVRYFTRSGEDAVLGKLYEKSYVDGCLV